MRGFIDKAIGGVGLRRGRTNIHKISAGDALDFWRVIDADEEKVLEELTEAFPKAKIIGHNQISSKDCPSFNVPEYLAGTKFADKAIEKILK